MTATIERNPVRNPIPGQEHKNQLVLHAHGCSGLQGAAVDRRKEKRPSERSPCSHRRTTSALYSSLKLLRFRLAHVRIPLGALSP